MFRLFLILSAAVLSASAVFASASDFHIRLAHNSPREQAAEKQLKRLLDTYDVSPYVFTYSVKIDENDAPHSHPILTLNDYFLDDDASALSTFIHEQFHWFAIAFEAETTSAIADLKIMYPTVPGGRNGGARDSYSTYAHLIVGLQEYQAATALFGREEAKRILLGKTWYQWIYRQVVEREEDIAKILKKHNLDMSAG